MGLVVLFKMNHNRIENLKIVGILLGISIAAGIGIDLFGLKIAFYGNVL